MALNSTGKVPEIFNTVSAQRKRSTEGHRELLAAGA
jgi:hypothetical protein